MTKQPEDKTPPIDIRLYRAGPADIANISRIAEQTWPVCYRGIVSDEQLPIMLEHYYSPEALARQMQEGQRFWIALLGGKVSGFASATQENDLIWLRKLYVLPSAQGYGLGKTLFEAIVANHANARYMRLNVNQNNHPAIAFYRRLGFEVAEASKVVMAGFEFDDYVMEKQLQSASA